MGRAGRGLAVMLLVACSGAEPEPPAEVPEKCRNVHLDKLAADWVAVRGAAADPKTRIRIMAGEAPGEDYRGWYNDGFFNKRVMKGVKRDKDVQFTEVGDEAKRAAVAAGESTLARLYVEPSLADCALKAFAGVVDKDDKETIPPRGFEFVAFPKQEGVEFTFRPADEPLFLGDAAKDAAVAARQLSELGAPRADHEFGDIPVGLWSDSAADGDASCTYDMDLYFDDQLLTELAKTPAGAVADGKRHWFHLWKAPYSGNHHFEIYRYRTCADGARTLLSVAGLEAILQ